MDRCNVEKVFIGHAILMFSSWFVSLYFSVLIRTSLSCCICCTLVFLGCVLGIE